MHSAYSLYVVTAPFVALHVMQTRYSDEYSIRPCLCVTYVICDKKRRNMCPEFYIMRKNIYSLLRKRTVSGERLLVHEILSQPPADGTK